MASIEHPFQGGALVKVVWYKVWAKDWIGYNFNTLPRKVLIVSQHQLHARGNRQNAVSSSRFDMQAISLEYAAQQTASKQKASRLYSPTSLATQSEYRQHPAY